MYKKLRIFTRFTSGLQLKGNLLLKQTNGYDVPDMY